MVPLASLWLPILLSAVLVFVVSAVIHMLLPYHRNDFSRLPAEDKVMDALRPFGLAPGEYMMPFSADPGSMKDPDHLKKMTEGPVAFMTVMPSGPPNMGKPLAWWFVYCLVVSLFAGYLASRTLEAGADYLSVFRVTGTVAFAGYVLALWQSTVWYHRAVSVNVKNTIDGLIYAVVTAGVFGWLW